MKKNNCHFSALSHLQKKILIKFEIKMCFYVISYSLINSTHITLWSINNLYTDVDLIRQKH